MIDLFDVVELTVDLPDCSLRVGMQGTIVDCHSGDVYEVEFVNDEGETLNLLALRSDQFIVIWRAKTKTWVPIAEQIAMLLSRLPGETEREVLDFTLFLHAQRQQSQAGEKTMAKEVE